MADWFIKEYMPLRLILRTTSSSSDDDKQKMEISYDLIGPEKLSQPFANLDRNVCLFLNELTGHGYFFSENAK